ncbi:MAG: GntR family transcriptional regulator [Ruthenibacterium lactatiformans]
MEDRHESFTLGLMRGDGAPLYRQLYRHIVEEIASGGLAAGEKLPSKRRLAADLRVSVSTVETAYQMLVAEGYIAARAKSGFTVCRIEKLDAPVRPAPAAPPEPPAKRWAYDFGTGSVDTALFPFKTWARIQRETVTAHPELLNHGSRQGDASLRAAIAKYLHAYRGVVCARPSRSWWARASNIWWACWPGCSAPAPLRWKIRAIPARRRCCATTACARCSCLWTGTA